MTDIRYRRLLANAKAPFRATPDAAGLDVLAHLETEDGTLRFLKHPKGDVPARKGRDGTSAWIEIPPFQRLLIPTGIAMALGPDLYARAAPRSGLAFKEGLHILAGVIDRDFRAEYLILGCNTDPDTPMVVKHGQRIAQIVVERISLVTPVEDPDLDETARGSGGFGSTGL